MVIRGAGALLIIRHRLPVCNLFLICINCRSTIVFVLRNEARLHHSISNLVLISVQAFVFMAVVRWCVVGRRVRNWLCNIDDACGRGPELVHTTESWCDRIDSILGKVYNLLEVHDLGTSFSASLSQIHGLFRLANLRQFVCFRWLVD